MFCGGYRKKRCEYDKTKLLHLRYNKSNCNCKSLSFSNNCNINKNNCEAQVLNLETLRIDIIYLVLLEDLEHF